MTVHLWDHRLTYLAVPKVACTSVKHAFFQIENGRMFEDYVANGQYIHIHKLYPTRTYGELPLTRIADHVRIALIRDPVRRLLSCYSNRVIYNRHLSEAFAGPALRAAGLKTNPNLSEFILRLADYCQAVPIIGHHAAPQVRYLGPDPQYFAAVFGLERMNAFAATIAEIVGQPVKVPRMQTFGPKFNPSDLSQKDLGAIQRFYEADYDIWGGQFASVSAGRGP